VHERSAIGFLRNLDDVIALKTTRAGIGADVAVVREFDPSTVRVVVTVHTGCWKGQTGHQDETTGQKKQDSLAPMHFLPPQQIVTTARRPTTVSGGHRKNKIEH